MNSSKKHKHLTLDDRTRIEPGFGGGASFKAISDRVGKDPTSISKEVRRGRTFVRHNRFNEFPNKCGLYGICTAKRICGARCVSRGKLCKNCDFCNSRCGDIIATDAASAARMAREHYDAAEAAARRGDWAEYGERIRRLGEAIRDIERSSGQTTQ